MPGLQGRTRLDKISRKWHDLAERRLTYFITLHRSGRWKHYYTEQRFLVCIIDAISAVRTWRGLAGQTKAPAADDNDLRPAA